MIAVSVLGGVRVTRDGVDRTPAGRLPQRLLAALASAAPGDVSVSELIEAGWGSDPPPTVESALRTHLSVVRRALDGGLLTGRRSYRISEPAMIDLFRYQELVDRAKGATDPLAEFTTLTAARDLWGGRPWGILADEHWLSERADALEELHRAIEDRWAELATELDLGVAHLAELQRLAHAQPLREVRWVGLIRALCSADRVADGLQAFESERVTLADQVGARPGTELLAAYDELFASLSAATPSRLIDRPSGAIVGRTAELAAVNRQLAEARVVTVTGIGGIGMTRVLQEIVTETQARGERAWLLGVPGAGHAERVVRELALQIGVVAASEAEALEVLVRHLASVDLLALDDAEGCLDRVAELVEVIGRRRPRCRLLVASRRPLLCSGEFVVALPPLEMPNPGADWRDTAAELLAKLRGIDLAGDPSSIDSVIDDCSTTGGIPLLIQLAARGAASALGEGDRVARTTIEPVDELEGPTQRIAAAMAIFPGGLDAELAASLTGVTEHEATRRIGHLVWLGLARVVTTNDARRYMMPRPFGDALATTQTPDQVTAYRLGLVNYLTALGKRLRPGLAASPDPDVFGRFDSNFHNLLAVLDHRLPGWQDAASGAAEYLGCRGYASQGAVWMSASLESTDARERADGVLTVARMARLGAHIDNHLDQLEEAVVVFRGDKDRSRFEFASLYAAIGRSYRQQLDRADELLDRAWPAVRSDSLVTAQYFELARSWLRFLRGDHVSALDEVSAIAQALDELDPIGAPLAHYLLVTCAQVDPPRARSLIPSARAAAELIDDAPMTAGILFVEAALHGETLAAVPLLRAAADMLEAAGMPERAAVARLRSGAILLRHDQMSSARSDLLAAVGPLHRARSTSTRLALAQLAASYRDEEIATARALAAASRSLVDHDRGYASGDLVELEIKRLIGDISPARPHPADDDLGDLLALIERRL